jgi:hypothetical protein
MLKDLWVGFSVGIKLATLTEQYWFSGGLNAVVFVNKIYLYHSAYNPFG